jgi:hypothetical protein
MCLAADRMQTPDPREEIVLDPAVSRPEIAVRRAEAEVAAEIVAAAAVLAMEMEIAAAGAGTPVAMGTVVVMEMAAGTGTPAAMEMVEEMAIVAAETAIAVVATATPASNASLRRHSRHFPGLAANSRAPEI